MKIHWGVVLVSLLAAACGGGSNTKGASTASTPSADSQIVMSFPAGSGPDGTSPAGKVDFSGLAFSQYDPDAKALLIYVLDPATQPAPSCDTVGLAAMMKQKSGTVATLVIKDFEGKAAKVKAGLGLFAQGDTSKLQTSPTAPLDATTVDITAYDSKTIEATVTTDASAKATVTGKIHGRVCPNTSMQKQAQQVQDDAIAKMQANGGMVDTPDLQTGETVEPLSLNTGSSQYNLGGATAFVKLDPKAKALLIFVPPPDVEASCDHLTVPAKGDMGRNFLVFGAKKIAAHGAGKYPVSAVKITAFGESTPTVENVALDSSTIDIHQFDDKTFNANFSSAPSATTKLSGPLMGTVCPDGHVDLPSGVTKPAKGGKKKK